MVPRRAFKQRCVNAFAPVTSRTNPKQNPQRIVKLCALVEDRAAITSLKESRFMFSHIMIGSNDIDRSKTFYDALFAAMGAPVDVKHPPGRLVYSHDGNRLIVTKPIDGQPATSANGGTLGFKMAGPDQVLAWHKAGVENGGTPIEDPPGERKNPMGTFFVAYLRDPDGNKLCAVYR
jgi:catechol 2,3-dioxygenase-like lactoylglutathione lyase family enzyme